MTPNQRDVFLYSWAKRRARGRLGNALLCAGIGAAGGLVFGLALAGDVGGELTPGGLASPSAGSMLDELGDLARLFGLAVPTFALLAVALGDRVFASNEATYQRLLAAGATPPAQAPQLTLGERGPQLAVAIVAALLLAFIVGVWVAYG